MSTPAEGEAVVSNDVHVRPCGGAAAKSRADLMAVSSSSIGGVIRSSERGRATSPDKRETQDRAEMRLGGLWSPRSVVAIILALTVCKYVVAALTPLAFDEALYPVERCSPTPSLSLGLCD